MGVRLQYRRVLHQDGTGPLTTLAVNNSLLKQVSPGGVGVHNIGARLFTPGTNKTFLSICRGGGRGRGAKGRCEGGREFRPRVLADIKNPICTAAKGSE